MIIPMSKGYEKKGDNYFCLGIFGRLALDDLGDVASAAGRVKRLKFLASAFAILIVRKFYSWHSARSAF